ncbi:MAG: AzlD domain-containing protein [Azospirillaceae bacterium]
MDAPILLLILALGLATFAFRAVPFLTGGRVDRLPPRLVEALDKLGLMVIAAILAVSLIPGPGEPIGAATLAPPLAGVAATIAVHAWLEKVGLTILAGMAAYYLATLAVG